MSVRLTKNSLAKVNVELIDKDNLRMRCMICGQSWAQDSPSLGSRLPKGWWKCPYWGCNDPEKNE